MKFLTVNLAGLVFVSQCLVGNFTQLEGVVQLAVAAANPYGSKAGLRRSRQTRSPDSDEAGRPRESPTPFFDSKPEARAPAHVLLLC
jgi:hypothetical protein